MATEPSDTLDKALAELMEMGEEVTSVDRKLVPDAPQVPQVDVPEMDVPEVDIEDLEPVTRIRSFAPEPSALSSGAAPARATPPPPPPPPASSSDPALRPGAPQHSAHPATLRRKPPPPPPRAVASSPPGSLQPAGSPQEQQLADARLVIETCQAELRRHPPAPRAARLHCEIAQAYEELLLDIDNAARHYDKALLMAEDHLPAIVGARRTYLAKGDFQRVLPLFDAEARLLPDPRAKAMVLYQCARLLEFDLGRSAEARRTYRNALTLDASNLTILKAVERLATRAGEWKELARVYESAANAVVHDPRLRAALLLKRARLVEERLGDPSAAAELCEVALRLDPGVLGGASMLARLYRSHGDWGRLVGVLERLAEGTSDRAVRGNALHEIGRLHMECLGNRQEAIHALRRAVEVTDGKDRQVLEDLAHLYHVAGEHRPLVETLERLQALASSAGERVALLHRMGHINERFLGDEEAAIRHHEAARALDPGHVPTLQALVTLRTRRGEWAELVEVYRGEAEANVPVAQRAAAHARVAEILEHRMGDTQGAMTHHARTLGLDPQAAASFKALARLYRAAGRYRELVELYEADLERTEDMILKIAYLRKIGALWEDALDDPLQAVHAYQRILDYDPDDLAALQSLQRACERAGRYRGLIDALEREIAQHSEEQVIVALMHRIGTVHEDHLGDRDAALAMYNAVLERAPRYQPVLSSMGRLFYRAGRWHDLHEVYRREFVSKGAGPEAVVLLYKMGELSEYQLGRDQDAVECYRRAVALDATYRPAMRALQRKLRELGAWTELLESLTLALDNEKDPGERARLLVHIGQLHDERLQRPAQAVAAYQQALELQPESWAARVALTRLYESSAAWEPLVAGLMDESRATSDTRLADTARLQSAEVMRDRLQDTARAMQGFESLLESPSGKLPALLALESLYEEVGAWEALATVHSSLASSVIDPGAQVAAFHELARIARTQGAVGADDRVATYNAILALAPDDRVALSDLRELSAGHGDEAIAALSRLAENASDDALAARYYASLGHVQEREGKGDALASYRQALARDPECLVAIRGLIRSAGRGGDLEAQADAARMQAKLVMDPERSAEFLAQSARLRKDRLGDPLGAIDDFERVLDIWPDSPWASKELRDLLLERGQTERLINVLVRAASMAQDPRVATDHWLDIADLQLEELGQVDRAIAALERALRATPDHMPALSRLGRAYIQDRRHRDAVTVLEHIIARSPDATLMCDSYMHLAEIFSDTYHDVARAMDYLAAILEIAPQHADALARLSELQLSSGDAHGAVATARHLVSGAKDRDERVSALIHLARLERQRNQPDRASQALIEAVTLEGPGGKAATACRELTQGAGGFRDLAAGLDGYIQAARASSDEIKRAYLELASVLGDRMRDKEGAVQSLERALTAFPGDPSLVEELARRLRSAGRADKALALLRRQCRRDPTQVDIWRAMIATLEAMGRASEAASTMAPLIVLGVANTQERDAWRARGTTPAQVTPGSFDADILRTIGVEHANAPAAAELLAALCLVLPRMDRPDLEALGLSRRDRVGSRSQRPIRALADQLASAFEIEYDLYLHPRVSPIVSVEMTEPLSIILGESVEDMSEAEQVFWLTRAMAPIAGRYHPVEKLSARKLDALFSAAVRTAVPGFAEERHSGDLEIESLTQKVRKAVPRRMRKAFEETATLYASDGGIDVPRWHDALRVTTLRAALLLADDLPTVAECLRKDEDFDAQDEGEEFVRQSPIVSDLLVFWTSSKAAKVRQALGLGRR